MSVSGYENPKNAYYFDGKDDYILINSDQSLNPVNQLSISFWVRMKSIVNDWSPILHKGGTILPNFENRQYAIWIHKEKYLHITSASKDSFQEHINSRRKK